MKYMGDYVMTRGESRADLVYFLFSVSFDVAKKYVLIAR